jgi:lipopolysaccharide exporter
LSEAKKALIGSFTLTFSKLSERLLGLISTLVLARLIVPDDFGIIAISLLVLGFFGVFSNTGSISYIIQKESVDDDDLNTAWTIDILVKNIVFVLLLISAPFAADFYDDERLSSVISVLGLMLVISSFGNPAFMLLRRNQSYGLIFKLDIFKKVVAVIVMLVVAFTYKNYWAMVSGHIVASVIQLVGSFVLVKYRPAFSMKGAKQQWLFTKWMLSKGMMGYTRSQLDTFLVSKFFGLAEVGAYHVMKYISTMPGSQIIEPATNPLLATFSRNKNDLANLQHQYKLVLVVVLSLALPLTTYLYVFSLPIVQILLGDNWVQHHEVFAVLSLLTFSFAIGNVSSQIIVCTGKIKSLFYYDLLTVVLMLGVLFSVANQSIQTFALYRVMFDWVAVILLTFFTMKTILKLNFFYFVNLFCSLSIIGILAGYLAKLTFIEDINVFIGLVLSSVVFGLVWLAGCFMAYKLHFYKTQEGSHIAFLMVSAKNKALGFLKRNPV